MGLSSQNNQPERNSNGVHKFLAFDPIEVDPLLSIPIVIDPIVFDLLSLRGTVIPVGLVKCT